MSLRDIEKKRTELWFIAILIIIAYSTSVIALSYFLDSNKVYTLFLGIFSFLFCSYVIDKERRLKELGKMLIIEEIKTLEQEATISLLNTRLKEISSLHQAIEAVSLERNPQSGLDKLLKTALELFKIDRGSIMLIDEEKEILVAASSLGLKNEFFSTPQKIGEGVAGRVAKTGEPLLLSGKAKGDRFKNFIEKEANIGSAICVPLRISGKVVGVLNCTSLANSGKIFTEYDLKLLSIFAQYASVAIENAQLRTAFKKGSLERHN